MSVTVKPWRRGGFQVTIRFRWPDRTVFRDRRVVDTPTAAQAKKWGEQREREVLAAGQPKPEDAKPKKACPMFKAFVDDSWLPTYPASAANRRTTIKEKKTHVRVHLAPFFGETRLDEIDRLMLDQFVAEMFEKTVGKDPLTAYEPKRHARRPSALERQEDQERDGDAPNDPRHRPSVGGAREASGVPADQDGRPDVRFLRRHRSRAPRRARLARTRESSSSSRSTPAPGQGSYSPSSGPTSTCERTSS